MLFRSPNINLALLSPPSLRSSSARLGKRPHTSSIQRVCQQVKDILLGIRALRHCRSRIAAGSRSVTDAISHPSYLSLEASLSCIAQCRHSITLQSFRGCVGRAGDLGECERLTGVGGRQKRHLTGSSLPILSQFPHSYE